VNAVQELLLPRRAMLGGRIYLSNWWKLFAFFRKAYKKWSES
jgi:hypothetical protein